MGDGKFISVWCEEIHFDPLSLSPLAALGASSLPEGEGAARGVPKYTAIGCVATHKLTTTRK